MEGGVGCSATILDLDTRWGMSSQLHAPVALPQGKEPPIPFEGLRDDPDAVK
jgi:hypothetical protein